MTPSDQYSVVVKVPKPEDTVFIAMPFHKSFNGLYSDISSAINAADLTPDRADKNRQDLDFIKDIEDKIRKARIVVAVLSMEPDSNAISPNVMYELGFARSIGKSIVLLTSDRKSLPADIKNLFATKYADNAVGSQAFENELQILLLKAKDKTKNRLTDKSNEESISVAYAKDWILIEPALYSSYTIVLRFAKEVHHLLQHFINSYINPLFMKATEIQGSPRASREDLRQQFMTCATLWQNYDMAYFTTSSTNDTVNPFASEWPQVDKAFNALQMDPNRNIMFNSSSEFYKALKKDLIDYIENNKKVSTCAKKDITINPDNAKISDFWLTIHALSNCAERGLINADSLLRNLINAIIYEQNEWREL